MDSIVSDSNINSVNNYSKDSLANLLNSTWYVTPINKKSATFIFEKNTNDYTFDYTLKINNDNLFEKSYKFKIDNTPNNFTGNWRLNDDKSLTLTYNNKKTILYILYIDNKEIIIKETNNKI
jgi:outer membrane receptor for ferric coprogen and ferric-rhodotorulic acid